MGGWDGKVLPHPLPGHHGPKSDKPKTVPSRPETWKEPPRIPVFPLWSTPVASGFSLGDEIADCHRLLAVGTAAPWANSATEEPAVRATLLAEISRRTGRTLVDYRRPEHTNWQCCQVLRARMPASPCRLTAGIRAEAASAPWAEGGLAHRADRRSHRYAVVTRRAEGTGGGRSPWLSHRHPSPPPLCAPDPADAPACA